jgi:hypothetical protein
VLLRLPFCFFPPLAPSDRCKKKNEFFRSNFASSDRFRISVSRTFFFHKDYTFIAKSCESRDTPFRVRMENAPTTEFGRCLRLAFFEVRTLQSTTVAALSGPRNIDTSSYSEDLLRVPRAAVYPVINIRISEPRSGLNWDVQLQLSRGTGADSPPTGVGLVRPTPPGGRLSRLVEHWQYSRQTPVTGGWVLSVPNPTGSANLREVTIARSPGVDALGPANSPNHITTRIFEEVARSPRPNRITCGQPAMPAVLFVSCSASFVAALG